MKIFEAYAAKRVVERAFERQVGDFAAVAEVIVKEEGGITFSFVDQSEPKSGFAVGVEGHEKTVPLDIFTYRSIRGYILDKSVELFEEGYCLGIWIDGNLVYLDLSLVFEDQVEASLVARAHKQLAYYDLAKKEEVRV